MIWALAQIIDNRTTVKIPKKVRIFPHLARKSLDRARGSPLALVRQSRRIELQNLTRKRLVARHAVTESLEISQNRSDQLLSSRILRAQTDSKEV